MKRSLFTLAIVGLIASSSLGALTLIEDFDNLNPGSIDMQHIINEYGIDVELWNAQRNSSLRGDSGWSTVVPSGPDSSQCLQLINRDATGEIDTVYTCLYLGYDNLISDQGTVYMQFQADGPNDCMVGTNDLINGFASDVVNEDIGDGTVYQGAANYRSLGAIWRMSGGEDFRAYAGNGSGGGSYENVAMGQQANTWYELWIQVDCPNKLSRFYICELGGTPQVVINPVSTTEWWGWRNTEHENTSVMNIKWNNGMYPWPDANIETTVLIDNIAVDSANKTLDRIEVSTKHPGDIDLDNDVDIFDFLVLKANYGTESGATWGMGDMDEDGDVDIFDFLVLKANYGWEG